MTWTSDKFKGRWSVLEDFYDYQFNQNKMNKFKLALKSRTCWTVVVLFVVNGVSGIQDLIPANVLPAVNGVLGILTIYFRVNARQ